MWLDDDAREDVDAIAILTGRDISAVFHDAIKSYKQSPDLIKTIEKQQQRTASALAALEKRK